jgi:hypothetical protein
LTRNFFGWKEQDVEFATAACLRELAGMFGRNGERDAGYCPARGIDGV